MPRHPMMTTRRSVTAPRLALASLAALVLAGGALATTPSTAPAGATATVAASVPLLTEVADDRVTGSRRGVAGDHLLVRLDTSALPEQGLGQRLALPMDGGIGHLRITEVERDGSHTAWNGALEGQQLSSFSLVRAGGTFRGSLVSPDGIYSLTRADGGRYWWSEVEPRRGAEGHDTMTAPTPRLTETSRDERARPVAKGKGRAKINLLFAYTKAARSEAGGRAELKAAAALVVAQTNEAFANSGLKVTVRYRGLAKAKGKESGNAVKDVTRLFRARDGRFDNLHKARRKNRADLVHLFTSGSQYDVCGAGNLPLSARQTHRALAWSTSFYSCMPYLVATHELGHNLGADHIDYPGVSHDSRQRGSYAFYNVAGNYLTAMGYYDPCVDAQIYTCVRIPWFSSPTNTYAGQPLGVGRATDNSRVIRTIAPKVARYVR